MSAGCELWRSEICITAAERLWKEKKKRSRVDPKSRVYVCNERNFNCSIHMWQDVTVFPDVAGNTLFQHHIWGSHSCTAEDLVFYDVALYHWVISVPNILNDCNAFISKGQAVQIESAWTVWRWRHYKGLKHQEQFMTSLMTEILSFSSG